MDRTVIELFAGVGGFRVGLNNIKEFDPETGRALENQDWNIVWANQWEPSTKVQHAYDCYKTRFGNEHISNTDISQIDRFQIPDHTLLVGGFPCQDYSVARSKSNEKGIEGKKGVLFWDIADILSTKRTPFFLLENVDRLLKSPAFQRGRDFGIMLRTLSDLGYDVEWRVINAADYGRAQRRRRVFIFGWRRDLKYAQLNKDVHPVNILRRHGLFAKCFPISSSVRSLRDTEVTFMPDTVEMTQLFKFDFENTGIVLNGHVTTFKSQSNHETPITLSEILDTHSSKDAFILTEANIEKISYLRGSKKIQREKPNGETYFYSEGSMSTVDSLTLPGRTMLTSEGTVNRSSHIVMDPQLHLKRFITPIEAERLQDFPDNWTDTGMPLRRRYFMMGNALVTGIINRIEPQLKEIIDNEQ